MLKQAMKDFAKTIPRDRFHYFKGKNDPEFADVYRIMSIGDCGAWLGFIYDRNESPNFCSYQMTVNL